jgi:stage V sporulation protein B
MRAKQKRLNAQGSFLSGALILALGGFVAKLLGAAYRIPLTNIMGAEGMGVYQLVFPLYALLLTVSSGGLNIAVSRLVAEKNQLNDFKGGYKVFLTAMAFLSVLGLSGSLFLFFAAELIAKAQGNFAAAAAYRAIAPAVFFVCVISAFRGYFQGRQNMTPTAVSQVIEQLVKMALAISLAGYFMPDVTRAATASLAAVSVSEIVAAAYLAVAFKVGRKNKESGQKTQTGNNTAISGKMVCAGDGGGSGADSRNAANAGADIAASGAADEADILHVGAGARADRPYAGSGDNSFKGLLRALILLAVPITISGIILPLTQLIDSVLVINIIGKYAANPTALFGLFAGPVNSLIGLPVVITLALAAAVVPSISRSRVAGDYVAIKNKATTALKLALCFSLPAAAGVCLLSYPISKFLYRGLSADELMLVSNLLKISAPSIIFLSALSVCTGILQALDRIYTPVKNLFFAAALKVFLNIFLLKNQSLNIYGAAISTAVCYFLAAVLNLFYVLRYTKISLNDNGYLFKLLLSTGLTAGAAYFVGLAAGSLVGYKLGLILSIAAAVAVFTVSIIVFKAFSREEIDGMPFSKKIRKFFANRGTAR